MESGALRAALSAGELACVEAQGLTPGLEAPFLALAEEQVAVMACLEEETVLRVFLGDVTGGLERLSVRSSGCVQRGTAGLDLRSVMTSALRGDGESMLGTGMAGLLVVAACLSEEEFAVAGPALGMGPGDREAQLCVAEAMGGVEELAAVLVEGEGGMLALMGALAVCGMSPGDVNTGE